MYISLYISQKSSGNGMSVSIYAYRYQYRVSDIRVSTEYRDR